MQRIPAEIQRTENEIRRLQNELLEPLREAGCLVEFVRPGERTQPMSTVTPVITWETETGELIEIEEPEREKKKAEPKKNRKRRRKRRRL